MAGEGRKGGELRELRKTERRNSRRPGKMRIVCTHEGNYPSSLPLATPCPIPIFSVSKRREEGGRGRKGRRERGERERESKRVGEGRQNSEFSRTFHCERIAESVARSRFPMKGIFSGILHNRSRCSYS